MFASEFVKGFDIMLEIQFHAFIAPDGTKPAKFGKFVVTMKSHNFTDAQGLVLPVRGRGDSIDTAFIDWCHQINDLLSKGTLHLTKSRRRSTLRAVPQPVQERIMPDLDLVSRLPPMRSKGQEQCDSL